MIRLLAVIVVVIPATVFHAIRVARVMIFRSPNADCVCEDVQRRWSKLLLRAAGVRVVLENAEIIDPEVPQVAVANHVSWFDVLALAAYMPGRYVFVAKKEIRRIPLFGPSVGACGHIYIDRGDRTKALQSLDDAKKRLEEEGPTVIMFPEGTRSATGELQPFKKGAFVLAIQTGAALVPTAIFGSRDVMRKGSLWIRPGVVRVRFGEPIPVTAYGVEQRGELTSKAWHALSDLQRAHGNA